jgi:hypothetical protein
MDPIAKKMISLPYAYADKDPAALMLLESRIAEAGKQFKLITYSDLVRDIEFKIPNTQGNSYKINTCSWTGLDRKIIGDFLAKASSRSYAAYGFMCNALVVDKAEYRPSPQFFKWMEWLGVLPDIEEDTVLKFWIEQVNKAHNWYAAGRRG